MARELQGKAGTQILLKMAYSKLTPEDVRAFENSSESLRLLLIKLDKNLAEAPHPAYAISLRLAVAAVADLRRELADSAALLGLTTLKAGWSK